MMKKSEALKEEEEEEEEEESPTSLKALEKKLVEAEKDLADAKKEVKRQSKMVEEAISKGDEKKEDYKGMLASAEKQKTEAHTMVMFLMNQIKEEKEAGLLFPFSCYFSFALTFQFSCSRQGEG